MHPVEFRLPAEWERQSAMVLAWPFAGGDWDAVLASAQAEYASIVEKVLESQSVVMLIQPGSTDARQRLGERPGLRYLEVPYNDTWCRDFGPITLVSAGRRLAMDFYFNGWGGRHEARLDNRVNTHLARDALFSDFEFRQSLFELEGGAIECDGAGTLLVNRHCLRVRHPHLENAEIDHELKHLLNASRLLEVDIPPMPGDDTDGHIDTLARFADRATIVFQSLADDARTHRLNGQLELLKTVEGQAYRLIALPHPADLDPGLAASYVNFIVLNDAVLVPAFGSSADDETRAILTAVFTDRTVKSIAAKTLVGQGGGPHCASMQIPSALA